MARILRSNGGTLREQLDSKYQAARFNLLLVIALTVINIVLLLTDGDSYFLFSAFIPYFLVTIGMVFTGKFPEEYYADGFEGIEFVDQSLLTVTVVIAAAIVVVYALCWLFSKKHKVGWLIAALVMFALDTIAMLSLGGLALETLIDVALHVWVLFDISRGIWAHYKWRKAPVVDGDLDFDVNEANGEENGDGFGSCGSEAVEETEEQEDADSQPLRFADRDVKHRVLLEAEVLGHRICYRRVKKTNELVIDGYVYDDITATIEPPHELSAHIDGHDFAVGYDGARSYCRVDGEVIAKKVRLI